MGLVTDEIRALMGVESEPRTSPVPVSAEILRRFVHGAMEDNPVHWDHEAAATSKYGGVVATPLFPLHAFRRAPGDPDPFDLFETDGEADGLFSVATETGLPPLDLPLKRVLNGGTEAEFFRLAHVGDVITARSKYLDVSERDSRNGSPMVIVRIATTYTNQHDDVLAVITMSMILR